jgi:hypothetical protein
MDNPETLTTLGFIVCKIIKLNYSFPEYNVAFSWVRVTRSVVFCVVYCRSLFVTIEEPLQIQCILSYRSTCIWQTFTDDLIEQFPGFIFFLVICEGAMALFSSWLYGSVSWLYFLPIRKEMKP